MSAENIARGSIEPSQHGAIDTELKNLKLLARRLQSVLTIHATELQILQRLYYKNKNQHRAALFWRNVIEIRRFLERIETLNLRDSINTLRSKFYDTAQNVNSIKGPWTQCPDAKYLSIYSEQCQKALKLVEKMAERCLDAYRSFHQSLQSAAFLQILLMFVAISSRTRTLAMELHEILQLINLCTNRLIMSIISSSVDGEVNRSIELVSLRSLDSMELHAAGSPFTSSRTNAISIHQGASYTNTSTTSLSNFQDMLPSCIIVEHTVNSKCTSQTGEESGQVKQASASLVATKKKKRKVPRNEIDDIFGF